MAKEIELKFLVRDRTFVELSSSCSRIRQCYLSDSPDATVRIRILDDKAYITVKGRNKGCERDEWEYEIPLSDAEEMAEKLSHGFSIDKTRYKVPYMGYTWEIDEFHGHHEGLIVAEVEMPASDCHPSLPSFIGKEVTGDSRYYNSVLAKSQNQPI
ncbi:MAG: CYTH domain-containing protein [Duncaniella sp.]|nr:CYTH domain-containing protein [Muribaculum sp.]MCM1255720.1 CYTH domain-containing protein [Duncaniella sp.]